MRRSSVYLLLLFIGMILSVPAASIIASTLDTLLYDTFGKMLSQHFIYVSAVIVSFVIILSVLLFLFAYTAVRSVERYDE